MSFATVEKNGHVGVLKLNNPATLNALSSQMFADLKEGFESLTADKEIYAIIITGEGKAFAAGADIGEMLPLNAVEGMQWGKMGNDFLFSIEKCEVPVIAAVNGFALGGGCELSLACDIRIASEKAKFGQPEVGLGIIPGFGGTQRLPRAVGESHAKELIFTGRVIDAKEAERIGLINRAVPAEELMAEAMKIAEQICANAQIAVKQAKKTITRGLESDLESGIVYEEQAFGLCFATEDQKIGMTAFVEKKKEKNWVNK